MPTKAKIAVIGNIEDVHSGKFQGDPALCLRVAVDEDDGDTSCYYCIIKSWLTRDLESLKAVFTKGRHVYVEGKPRARWHLEESTNAVLVYTSVLCSELPMLLDANAAPPTKAKTTVIANIGDVHPGELAGNPVLRLSVAVDENDGDTSWYSCIIEEHLTRNLEALKAVFTKGRLVYIKGQSRAKSYLQEGTNATVIYTGVLCSELPTVLDAKPKG